MQIEPGTTTTIQVGKVFTDLGLEHNFATNTKWLCYMPLQTLFPDMKGGLALNLTSWRTPEITIGLTERATYFTKQMAVPSKVLTPESQEITFEYLLSSNFSQYIILYRWIQRIIIDMQKNSNFQQIGEDNKYRIPVSMIFLSEFKTPVLQATYQNAWLWKMGPVEFDYQNEDDQHIRHEFTLKFTHVDYNTLADVNGVDGRVSKVQEESIIATNENI